jgi:hypothetical protein
MAEGSRRAVRADDELVFANEVRELKRQVRELERMLGKKTIENEILREAVTLAQEKNYSRGCLAATGRFPVKAIADMLEVSSSNLIDRSLNRRSRRAYRKADDGELLAAIRPLVDQRPTYGLSPHRGAAEPGKGHRWTAAAPTINASIGSCAARICSCSRAPVSASIACTTALSRRCDPIRVGAPTASRSTAGTGKSYASPLCSTLAIAR